MRIRFNLNNQAVEIETDADERLSDVLRRDFGLLSVKKSCMQETYNSCTVLLNDHAVPSCMLPIFAVAGQSIITLEAFSATQEYKDIITAFDPHMIVLGGGLSNFDYLYEALPKALPPHLMRSAKVPPIKKAKHGDSGGVRGAAALFLKRE